MPYYKPDRMKVADSLPQPTHSPRNEARTEDAEAREKLDETLRNNAVVNLGKVEDIGKQTTTMMTLQSELRGERASRHERARSSS
ncbi:MAG: hypothetical protein ABI600_03290 [Luteolibacter sp.]